MMKSTAVYVKVPEGYITFVEKPPGANTQGSTLEKARANLHEAAQLVLEANRALAEEGLEGREVIREPLPTDGGAMARAVTGLKSDRMMPT